jgi:alanyl-tRNA synthetase
MTGEGTTFAVVDALTGAVHLSSGQLFVDKEIPIKRSTAGWVFVVAHLVALPAEYALSQLLGQSVSLAVDTRRRHLLSAAHTACHLMALALNKCTGALWHKATLTDSLGHPDFDKQAIVQSQITLSGSHDYYRLGTSLRKQGFDSTTFFVRLHHLEHSISTQLAVWLNAGPAIHMEAAEPTLEARRWWICPLPDGVGRIPCGGTHLPHLQALRGIRVAFVPVLGTPEVVVHTNVEIVEP